MDLQFYLFIYMVISCTSLYKAGFVFYHAVDNYHFRIKTSSLAGYFPQVDCRTFDVLVNGMRYLAPQKRRLI